MKKLVTIFITAVMLVSAWGKAVPIEASAVSTVPVITFSEEISVSGNGSGMRAGEDSSHGNQQTRIVHTSHGDYVAYCTDTFEGWTKLHELSIMKINEDNTTKLIYSDYKPYGSSSISLVVDSEENVWGVVMEGDIFNIAATNRSSQLFASAYRVDAETDEVMAYSVMLDASRFENYGKTELCYDSSTDEIYVMIGTNKLDGGKGARTVAVFDVETRTWDPKLRHFISDADYIYTFVYPDGKGGLYAVGNRTSLSQALGYGETGHNIGLTEAEIDQIKRWPADYLWDSLRIAYYPDIKDDSRSEYSFMAVPADFSKVIGDRDYKNSFEGRSTNLYPNVMNNNGGDFFLSSDGYLHLVYNYTYLYAAGDRSSDSSIWYHGVYDISEPTNMKEVYQGVLSVDTKDGVQLNDTSWRMYEDSKGQLYLISGAKKDLTQNHFNVNCTLRMIAVDGNPVDGYEYRTIASRDYVGNKLVTISNNRSNSLEDNELCVIYKGGENLSHGRYDDYRVVKVKIDYPEK